MELLIHFTSLPEGMTLRDMEIGLDEVLQDDGWILASRFEEGKGLVDIELEDEKNNPKYGIIGVKAYLQNAEFAPDTAIELAGKPVGIYE